MPKCNNCGKDFPSSIDQDGKRITLGGRRFCLDCSPLGAKNRRTYVVKPQLGKAFCARCRKELDRSMFYSRKDGSPLSYCQECQEEAKLLKLDEKIEKAIALKGGACADCGGVFPAPVFQFRKGDKIFAVSRAKNMSWARLEAILADHEMLCLNCCAMRNWAGG